MCGRGHFLVSARRLPRTQLEAGRDEEEDLRGPTRIPRSATQRFSFSEFGCQILFGIGIGLQPFAGERIMLQDFVALSVKRTEA